MADMYVLEKKVKDALALQGENTYRGECMFVWKDGTKEKRRVFIKDGRVWVMQRGRRRYGSSISGFQYDVIDILPINKKPAKPDTEKWRDAMIKIRDRLEKSGLWKDILADVKLALDIGQDKLRLGYDQYWLRYDDKSYDESVKINLIKLKAIDPRLIKVDENGREYENTQLLWHLSGIPKVKKMNFGRPETNAIILADIKRAMANKEKIDKSGRTNYDVSFGYNPELNQAWYSEEYTGMGNGHYYLALDETHAIFWEDD